MNAAILESLTGRSLATDGIDTAGRFLRGLQACLNGTGECTAEALGAKSFEEIATKLRELDGKLIYSGKDCVIEDLGTKGAALTPGSILDFDAIISTSSKDRDEDILDTSGASLDPRAPFLLFHDATLPCGKLVAKTLHTKDKIAGRFCLFDTQLGRDASILIQGGGLRISHGFDPETFSPLKNGRYLITKFSIYEVSGVPIPSNPEAVITAWSKQHLSHPFVKAWAKSVFDSRPAQAPGVTFTKAHEDCHCGGECDKCQSEKHVDDPVRWNKSLSKAFDVANAPVEPASMCYDWASKYLEVPVKNVFDTETFIPSARMGSWLSAFRKTTGDYNVVDIRNIHGSFESPPIYESIQLKSNLSETFLIEGTIFYSVQGKAPLIIAIRPQWGGVAVRAFSRYDQRAIVIDLFEKTWQVAKEQNFLKGEAFSLSGEFIPRGGENWPDVFLAEKNEKVLTRLVNNINAKGKSNPNRGIIMLGPPGTGKTLSGRIIKNQANATFIWISARDFHRSGAFGGFEYAFELAKELAPCVLFFEDIDNWIGDQTVDLMKTEMDGLTKSCGIATILTTNFPENLPEALVDRPGRFHDVLKMDLPSDQVRKSMLRKWVPSLSDSDIAKSVERTKGYSGAHMYELSQFAKSLAESEELGISSAIDKALDKIEEQRALISQNLLAGSRYRPRKNFTNSFSSKRLAMNIDSTKTPATVREDNARLRGEGPQAGDVDWPDRHNPDTVRSDALGNGVDNFDPGNTAQDATMSIATGSMTGAQQNPAPDTALASNTGQASQPAPPPADNANANPQPRNDWDLATGGKSINDSSSVISTMSDTPGAHDTAGNIDSQVNLKHLKSVARMVKHCGKEGSVYLHPQKAHVHHVMHADDIHPDNQHVYHQPDQLEKMYGCVHGVSGVKCTVGAHPAKSMGYRLIHKGAATDDSGMNDVGDMDGAGDITAFILGSMKTIETHLKFLYAAPESDVSQIAKEHVIAAGKTLRALNVKFSSLEPNMDGGYTQASIPAPDVPNRQSSTGFTGVPANNAPGPQATQNFSGTPPVNDVHQFPTHATQPGGKTTHHATNERDMTGSNASDPEMSQNVNGVIRNEVVSHEAEVLKWLEEDVVPEDPEAWFDEIVAEAQVDEFLTV